MNRYKLAFENLEKENKTAFVPFTVIADPDLRRSKEIIEQYIEAGATMLELGLPFSDPVADGPVIQAASQRALASGATMAQCFALINEVRKSNSEIPIGLLVYANLVYHNGIESFYKVAKNAGVDSVLIADLPVTESDEFCRAAKKHEISQVFICPPNADTETIKQIAKKSEGYVYVVSRAGVTGKSNNVKISYDKILKQLKDAKAAPPLLGFGISNKKQQSNAIKAGFAGVICGSDLVKEIPKVRNQKDLLAHLEKKLSLFITNR